jgi:hypothetical protein
LQSISIATNLPSRTTNQCLARQSVSALQSA